MSLIYALSARSSVHHSPDETFNTEISVKLPPTSGEKCSLSPDKFARLSSSSVPGVFPFNLKPFVRSSWRSDSYFTSLLGECSSPREHISKR